MFNLNIKKLEPSFMLPIALLTQPVIVGKPVGSIVKLLQSGDSYLNLKTHWFSSAALASAAPQWNAVKK